MIRNRTWGAAIAPWFRLRLPSCGPGFESQAHDLCFFQFVLLKLLLELEKNENKQKEAGIGPYLKKIIDLVIAYKLIRGPQGTSHPKVHFIFHNHAMAPYILARFIPRKAKVKKRQFWIKAIRNNIVDSKSFTERGSILLIPNQVFSSLKLVLELLMLRL